MDVEQTVDQVELQRHDAALAPELAAQQPFLGRAIHARDEVALARRAGEFLGGHLRRRRGRGRAVAAATGAFRMGVAMGMRVGAGMGIRLAVIVTVTVDVVVGVGVFLMCHGGGLECL